MKFQVLISCMHQKNHFIIERLNVQSDAVIINQCNTDKREEFTFINNKGESCHVLFISTTDRGLSKSRNMAIKNSTADICLICDDDELLEDNVEDIIINAYEQYSKISVMLFALKRNDCSKTYPKIKKKLSYKQILKSSSHQISFKRENIIRNDIMFDEKMGSGTGNGGGEENKFLFDCKKKGLKLLFFPSIIATIEPSPSQWFEGYTPEFIRNLGWSTRRSQGDLLGFFYSIYWVTFKHTLYKNNMSYLRALKSILTGYFDKR